MSLNDITKDKLISKIPNKAYLDNFDKIFSIKSKAPLVPPSEALSLQLKKLEEFFKTPLFASFSSEKKRNIYKRYGSTVSKLEKALLAARLKPERGETEDDIGC